MVLIIVAVVVVLMAALIIIYNKLVRLRNTVRAAWSDVDVQIKKRFDLVPNIVETVKGYATHEKALFEKVSEARSHLQQAESVSDTARAENELRNSLKNLVAVAEAYPELKANVNFQQLQSQLQQLEDNIEYARRYYNAVVRDFNILIQSFPSNIVASQFRFFEEELFHLETPALERQPVKVDFE